MTSPSQARRRLLYGKRCACGKVRAGSVRQAKAMLQALADHNPHIDQHAVWFYDCTVVPGIVHWTRRPHDGDGWTPKHRGKDTP